MRYVIPTKLVGVSFKNDDTGIDRQELISKLKDDDVLLIEHEENNPYDKNSHVVKSRDGILGHVSRSLAEDLMKKKSEGEKILGIKEYKKTGTNTDKHTLGVNIIISLEKPE